MMNDLSSTPWQGRRFGARSKRSRVLLGQTYEDVAIERGAFSAEGRVFCIAASGTMALALSERHEVVACDINPAQLAYAARRIAGGAVEVGATERAIAVARRLMTLAGWHPSELRAFLALSQTGEQVAFWRTRLDTWRFRTAFDAIMSLAGFRTVYAAALLDVLPSHFGAILRGRMLRCFSRHANATNPYAHELLLGDPETGATWPTIAAEARRIHLVLAGAASYLEGCAPASFAGFSLSNILDGARPGYRDRLTSAVRRAAAPEAMVVARSYAEPLEPLSTNRAADDRAMIWGSVDVCAAAAWSAS
jgi:S-adenosylmethionine:diacylglycerol 3-amino-3-carboxypropyl transferase